MSAPRAPSSFWRRPGRQAARFGRVHHFEQSTTAISAPVYRLPSRAALVDVSFASVDSVPRYTAKHGVDGHRCKTTGRRATGSYAAFRLAMTCLKSDTNST
jgi:hypothetical protein